MRVAEIKTTDLNLDPKRFQYKLCHSATGSTGSLNNIASWNVYLSGIVLVWKDPFKKDNKIYVVNGHNRVTLANKLGVEKILCRFIDTASDKDALSTGALTNMAEGCGTAIDAAKFFRESKCEIEEIKKFGVNHKLKIVQDGLKLSKLINGLFDKVVTGELSVDKGVIFGAISWQQQKEVWEQFANKQISAKALDEIIQNIVNPATGQTSLFNLEVSEDDMVRAELTAQVKTKLQNSKKLLGLVVKNDLFLESIGNNLAREQNLSAGEVTNYVLQAFDQLKNQKSPVSDVLNQGVLSKKEGKGIKSVTDDCVNQLIAIIPQMINQKI